MAEASPSKNYSTKLEELFILNSCVFTLDPSYYGCFGTVAGHENRQISVNIVHQNLLGFNLENYLPYMPDNENEYISMSDAIELGKFNYRTFSKITGAIYVSDNVGKKFNIGLNLKSKKRNEERPGFTKKHGYSWMFTMRAIELVDRFRRQFPEIFHHIDSSMENEYHLEDIYPDEGIEYIKRIHGWLKRQDHKRVRSVVSGSKFLSDNVVSLLEEDLGNVQIFESTVRATFSPEMIYQVRPNADGPPSTPQAYCLLDRVITCRVSETVPLGVHGFIIGIHGAREPRDLMYFNILFDVAFENGISLQGCSPNRAYKLSEKDFINISHGLRTYSPTPDSVRFQSFGANKEQLYDSAEGEDLLSVSSAPGEALYNNSHFAGPPVAAAQNLNVVIPPTGYPPAYFNCPPPLMHTVPIGTTPRVFVPMNVPTQFNQPMIVPPFVPGYQISQPGCATNELFLQQLPPGVNLIQPLAPFYQQFYRFPNATPTKYYRVFP